MLFQLCLKSNIEDITHTVNDDAWDRFSDELSNDIFNTCKDKKFQYKEYSFSFDYYDDGFYMNIEDKKISYKDDEAIKKFIEDRETLRQLYACIPEFISFCNEELKNCKLTHIPKGEFYFYKGIFYVEWDNGKCFEEGESLVQVYYDDSFEDFENNLTELYL